MKALEHLSDEELVALIQNDTDSTPAFPLLLTRCLPMLRARVRAIAGSVDPQTYEDYVQEGLLGFLRAVSAYTPARDASFRTFAMTCAGNSILSALRKTARSPQTCSPLDDLSHAPSLDADPQDAFLAEEQYTRIQNALQHALSPLESSVLEQFLAGVRYATVAKQLGISPKAVDNALQRIRKKLKHLLN